MGVMRAGGPDDIGAVMDLLERAGDSLAGMTNLLGDRSRILAMLQASASAFAGGDSVAETESYLFVLEEGGDIIGTSGIMAGVGLDDAFYSYRVGRIVKASSRLNIHNQHRVLYLSNDYTGASELCRLFLDPAARGGGNGTLLSVSRLLFIAEFPDRFTDPLIAEFRGLVDDDGNSPFWEGLPAQFLTMTFSEADERSGSDKSFIAELMPSQPVYVSLLRPETQAAIGEVHTETRPAKAMLEREGFRYRDMVDIFDGGATVEATRDQLRVAKRSDVAKAVVEPTITGDDRSDAVRGLVSNRRLDGFRAVAVSVRPGPNGLGITAEAALDLQIETGDEIRWIGWAT